MQNRKLLLIPAIIITAGILLIIIASASWLLISGFVVVFVGFLVFVYMLNSLYKFIKIEINMSTKRIKKHNKNKTYTQRMDGFVVPTDVVVVSKLDTTTSVVVVEQNKSTEEHKVTQGQRTKEVVVERKSSTEEDKPQLLAVNLKNKWFESSIYKLVFECNNSNADLYYSIDGDRYKKIISQIQVDFNCKISVFAERNGQKSAVIEELVEVFKVNTPTISVLEKTIRIQTDTNGSKIYYTLDGKEPSKDSSLYKGDFTINKSCTIKAIAVKEKWNDSDIVSQQVTITPTKEERVRRYTDENHVVGLSYRGDSHIKTNSSCQDYHYFEKINDEWSIAIVSDGAGSAKHSDEGSRAVCAAFTYYIKKMIETEETLRSGNIFDAKTWDIEFKGMLSRFQTELKKNLVKPDMPFESFAATIILFIFSSKGYMVAHVGDGRAGIKVNGEWQSIISPHKGEEANQTIFSTSKYFGEKYIPNLKMSNVYVPETNCSNIRIEAFVLMSDGCENGAWMTYQRKNLPNGDFRVEDVNLPRSSSLDLCLQIIDLPNETRKKALVDFITESSNAFVNEPDDKTILIGKVI